MYFLFLEPPIDNFAKICYNFLNFVVKNILKIWRLHMSRLEEFELLYNRVNATKNALVFEWKQNGCFKDKNDLTKSGILPESIGLTSVLLMFVAFANDEKVFDTVDFSEDDICNADISGFTEIINASFKNLFQLSLNGFKADPLLNKKHADFFNEERGYTECVTWCMSASVLAIYAKKHCSLELEPEVYTNVLKLLGESFKALVFSQRDDGTWGFATDKKCKRSIYFTYIASASLADFFDYILDEISLIDSCNDEAANIEPIKEVVEYLDKFIGKDVVSLAIETREKLDKFLIENCLPILPKLSECTKLEKSELDILGMNQVAPSNFGNGDDEKYYHNLYYTYYILDMLITANADKYFSEMIQNEENRLNLLAKYKPLLTKQDYNYYNDPQKLGDFFTNFYEQALHSSRMNYMSAIRTGDEFWQSSASELPIKWEHEDSEINRLAFQAIDQSKATLSDPTLLPMALRANVVYSFYVTQKPEITIERLFKDVCNNVYMDDDESDECTKDLWDDVRYNIMVTERSIEAIVDYYDYLNKFSQQAQKSSAGATKKTMTEANTEPGSAVSAVDAAIEAKIAQYLSTEAGISLIRSALPTNVADTTMKNKFKSHEMMEWLQDLTQEMSKTNITSTTAKIPELMLTFIDFFDILSKCSLKKRVGIEDTKQFEEQKILLIKAIFKDISERRENANKYDLTELYKTLKECRDDK